MLIQLICKHCLTTFQRDKRFHTRKLKLGFESYCSRSCQSKEKTAKASRSTTCTQCSIPMVRTLAEIRKSKSGLFFCSRSCVATHTNSHKTTGVNRSKLEFWLESQLTVLFPSLEIIYNGKEAIEAELDIYISSLNLAFELNGIFHYEPIFGESKLARFKSNDQRKFQACLEKDIELCIIDSSNQKLFTEASSQKYLDIIKTIIELKLGKATRTQTGTPISR